MAIHQQRSPVCWVGGKFYSAKRIIEAFPPAQSYKTFVEVFGGAANILLNKPVSNHLEIFNDYNRDLINFWMQCRNYPEELQRQIDSLPYARSLYDEWQESLFDGSVTSEMERAVRWFYVLRNSVGGIIRRSRGNWGYDVAPGHNVAEYLHSAAELFLTVSQRFCSVQIECRDFEHILRTYERPITFFYCDPPYIGAEAYYEGIPPFTMVDHERLALLLNKTPAQVALSYYPHPLLEEWYPASMWRRITWQTYKHSERTKEKRQQSTEMLLCNYSEPVQSLWSLEEGA